MTLDKPRVSVIIPVYNGERYFARTIESVLAQTYSAKEIVIVDDGSRDTSQEVIARYLHHSNVHLVTQKNAGVAAARNTGISAAAGEYIALVDQDDLWLPDKLARQVEYLDAHPEIALVHSNIHFIDEAGERIPDPEWAWVAPTFGQVLPELVKQNSICTCTVLLRKSVLEQVGLFRQELAPADDWDLWLRIAAKHPIGFVGAVGKAITRAKLYSLCNEAAQLLVRSGRHTEARGYWLRAMRKNPVASKPYASLILGALPVRQRRALAWYGKRMRGLFAGKQK